MRLQPKKLNQLSFPPIIIGIFLLSLLYWFYLSMTTHMDIVLDAVGYESLGRMIQTQGWVSYFTTGPNREPLYPFLIALSMCIEHLTGFAYTHLMAFLGVIFLFLTQVLTYQILRLLNIRTGICIWVLAYLGFSPALNNAAFSLYSEIAIFPFILGIILTSFYAWEAIIQNELKQALIYSICLGILLAAATLIKAVFECVTPVYLIILFGVILFAKKKIASAKKQPRNDTLMTVSLCVVAALSFYYIPITGYKCLNKHYNGNFAITNRASWALYGNTARRMEPLTPKRLAEALAYAPGEGVCDSLFGHTECDFWSFRKSDELGFAKQGELGSQHLCSEKINAILLQDSIQKALHDPFQYTLLTVVEGLKMFFWESTKVGFVDYPHWLQKIYDIKLFNNGLRFLVSLISFLAMLSMWRQALAPPKSPMIFLIGVLIFLYILFFSFFFILTRYALPIAPLYLISIGLWINQKLAPKEQNKI